MLGQKGPAGKLVVQVYFSQDLAPRVRFQRALLGFAKVDVPAGARGATAHLELPATGLEAWDKGVRDYAVYPGTYTLYVGQHSLDSNMQHVSLTVTAA